MLVRLINGITLDGFRFGWNTVYIDRLRYQREKEQQKQQKQDNKSSYSSNSTNDNNELDPSKFKDACEILGMGQKNTRKEYKAAYLKLCNLYHPDKIAGLSGARRNQAENESKQINAAWTTIKKNAR